MHSNLPKLEDYFKDFFQNPHCQRSVRYRSRPERSVGSGQGSGQYPYDIPESSTDYDSTIIGDPSTDHFNNVSENVPQVSDDDPIYKTSPGSIPYTRVGALFLYEKNNSRNNANTFS